MVEGSPIINLVNLALLSAIRDGASDIHIEPDRRKTRIRYRIEGAMNAFETHDELFWNVVGTSWPVPIEQVDVSVEVPGASSSGIQIACFAGRPQSTAACYSATLAGQRAVDQDEIDVSHLVRREYRKGWKLA